MFIKILIIAAISLTFTNCTTREKNIARYNQNTENTPVSGAAHIKSDSEEKVVGEKEINTLKDISGSVFFTNSYCGGIKPSAEILEALKKEHSLVNSTILFQNVNDKSKSIKIATDDNGNFISPLEAGTYNYFMTQLYSKTMGCAFNSACDIWLKRSFGQITILEGKTEGYKIVFNFGCNPCEPKRP